jgi:hypothetical protein
VFQQNLRPNPEELRRQLEALDCTITLETTLKTYPNSIHWHIKHKKQPKGILEATWLPCGEAWLSYHTNRHQPWIDDVLIQFT